MSGNEGTRGAEAAPEGQGRLASLTPTEREIVALLLQGCRRQEIAAALSIGLDSLQQHLQGIFHKLGVSHPWELILLLESEPRP